MDMVNKEQVLEALRGCYDPEVSVNIVDLGLVYKVSIENGRVDVEMTLTSPGCPMSRVIERQVKEAILKLEGAREARVKIVWEPPWTPDRMSPVAKRVLGIK